MKESDYYCLEEFLYQSIYIASGEEKPSKDIIYLPEIYVYIKDFGKNNGDFGVVAERDNQIIGVAWTRILDKYPELVIAVLPEYRKQGRGTDGVVRTYNFETDGGTFIESLDGINVVSKPFAEKENYYFGGWYNNPEFVGEPVAFPYFSKNKLTLYAKWLEEQPGGPATEGLAYELIWGTSNYRVSGYNGTSAVVFIPSIYNGQPVTEIRYSAFAGNSLITQVTIGNGITKIGNYAFAGCSMLETVVIGTGVRIIESNVFSSCSKLTSVNIPEGVEKIDGYLFYDCTSLASVTIPSTVTRIESWAFYRCPIISLVVPSIVTYIGYSALYCMSLTSITIEAEVPPALYAANPNPFGSVYNLIIYVPENSLDAYKNATGWSTWANIYYPINNEK